MKFKHILCAALVASFTFSCDKEELLEKSPSTRLSGDSYNSEANMLAALYASYDVLQWQAIEGNHVFPLMWQDIRADDMHSQFASFWGAGTIIDDFRLIEPDMLNIRLLWQKWYTGVNRANLVIAKAGQFNGWKTEGLKETIIAEAKTLRAFYYFEMLKMWGGVPLVTNAIESNEDLPILERATREEMYLQIDKDLVEAIPSLPLKSATPKGRLTRGVAQTLLAKSKLYQEDWAGVIENTEAVMQSGQYQLEQNFASNWDLNNENGVESILEIQYADGYTPEYFEGASVRSQGSGSWQMMFTWVGGKYTSFSNMLPLGELKSQFESGDVRRDATFIEVGTDLSQASPKLAATWGNPVSAPQMSWLRPNLEDCNYARKYFLSWEVVDQLLEKSQSPLNEKIIRYAEVLLMHAEAASNGATTSFQSGQASLDQIRDRAGLDPVTLSLDAVKKERRTEMATEGWNRFSDLMRWGVDASTNTRLAAKHFQSDRDELLPIPQAEIDIVGKDILKQNPGYN